MSTIVITVDLGHFKAFKINQDPVGRPIIDLIESIDSIEAHGKLSDKLSDGAGRFRGGGGKDEVARGFGDPRNIEADLREKIEKNISEDINALIRKECPDNWYLAAPSRINKNIVDNLEPRVKALMTKNIASDITKVPEAELMGHFK